MSENENRPMQGSESAPAATPIETEPVVERGTVTVDGAASQTASAPQSGIRMALIVVGAVILLAAGYFLLTKTDLIPSIGTSQGEAVATVNGEKIFRTELENNKRAIAQNYSLQGGDPTEPTVAAQIEEQALTTLVNTRLLAGVAKDGGFSATEEEIDTEYANIVTQFGGEDALKTQMQTLGLSEKDVREDIGEQIAITRYVEANVDASLSTVTEEEIITFYNSVELPEGQELPPLEEVRGQIEAQLQSEKTQEAIAALIESIKADASIEILI